MHGVIPYPQYQRLKKFHRTVFIIIIVFGVLAILAPPFVAHADIFGFYVPDVYDDITENVNETNNILAKAFKFSRTSPYSVVNSIPLTSQSHGIAIAVRNASKTMALVVATLLLMVDFFRKSINFEWSSKWENILIFLIKILVIKQVVQNADTIVGYVYQMFDSINKAATETSVNYLPNGNTSTYTATIEQSFVKQISKGWWDFWYDKGAGNVYDTYTYHISADAVRMFYPDAVIPSTTNFTSVDSFVDAFPSPTEKINFFPTWEMAKLQPLFLIMKAIAYIVFVIVIGRVFELSIYTIFADSKARAQYTQQIFSKLDSLVNIVNGESSDAAKIRKAMVLVMNMNIYAFSKDSRAASGAVKPVYNEQYDQSLYSSIMLGYSVCAGYAKAMQAILSSCGIHIVTATSYNTKASTGHAWNYVYMNGAWYQVDATWEDNDSMHYNAQDGSYQPDVWVRDNTIDNFTDHFYLISDSRMDYYDSQQSVSGMHQAIYYYTNLINFPVCNANYPSRSGYITADFTDYRSDFTRKYSVTPIVANAANAKFKLVASNLEYNGMEQRPAVRVVVNGRVLSSYYFTAAYPASSKAIGTYKVKIKLRNGYSGSKTLSYNITSKKTKLSSVKAGHGSIKVKWKKVKKQNTGYQIIISTNKNFKKGNKKVLVKGSKKSSKTVNGLKSGRKYFVKVRTYKTVGGKKIFSDWSNKKTVRVR